MSSVCKRPKNDLLSRNKGLNRSIRVKDRKKRVHDQVHVGLQDRLEKEMKIRDGATRLMGACTHETQLLEAAKTLHTSNARTMAYMAQLQKLKAAEVMEAIMDESGLNEEPKVCKGRLAVSDIRIPLTWKDIFSSNKAKESTRHAVFCLVSVGSEVQDTELVCVDKNTTDIAFADVIVFENAGYDFHMNIEVFACPMSSSTLSAPTPQKLMSRLNRSIGKGDGKRMREHMKENMINGVKSITPMYTKIASSALTLNDVCDAFKSHDLDRTNQNHLSLPLYESLTCRMVAQPRCITDICVSGFLHYLHMAGSAPNWSYLWCEVKSGVMKGWRNPEETNSKPQFSIDLIPKDIKVNEIEKSRQRRAHSFQVRDLMERHIFASKDNDDLIKWIRGIRQHKSDHGAWGVACISDPVKRTPMFIASPSPRNSDLMFDRGVRKTLIYEQMDVDSPPKSVTSSIRCFDMLNDPNSDRMVAHSINSVLLENQTTAPWTGFFTGLGSKPAKVIKKTDVHRNLSSDAILQKHSYNLRPSALNTSPGGGPNNLGGVIRRPTSSEASGSDDAFFSDSENRVDGNRKLTFTKKSPTSGVVGAKKKRRAPTSPWDEAAKSPLTSPPPKPPLPRLPPKHRSKKRGSLSSSSSLDGILEERYDGEEASIKARSRINAANKLIGRDDDFNSSHVSLRTQRSSQSSGYKSESEGSTGSKLGERVWAKEKNCVIPLNAPAQKNSHCFKKSKSLDCDGYHNHLSTTLAPSGESNDSETEGRPRTNTMPKTSPSRSHPDSKSVPAPRRSYLTAVESSKVNHVYETVQMAPPGDVGHDNGPTFRRLHYDEDTRVFCQAKPPALPPKIKKKPKDEPIYAEIDKSKKRDDREGRARRGVDAYTKAHRAVITVCKQRMEEEAAKQERSRPRAADKVEEH